MNDLNAPDEITLRWNCGVELTLGRNDIPDAIARVAALGGEDVSTAMGEVARTMARFAIFAEETFKANSGAGV